ncbi:hypothetical protein LDENG_00273210 [Lucifuga dentata]|nr:hypothetical protein LDENG_00273210 [Lucifuga dentata]
MHVFGGGRKPEETHADMGRTCKLHTERTQSDSNPGRSCCEATELTTEPRCHPPANPILMIFVLPTRFNLLVS